MTLSVTPSPTDWISTGMDWTALKYPTVTALRCLDLAHRERKSVSSRGGTSNTLISPIDYYLMKPSISYHQRIKFLLNDIMANILPSTPNPSGFGESGWLKGTTASVQGQSSFNLWTWADLTALYYPTFDAEYDVDYTFGYGIIQRDNFFITRKLLRFAYDILNELTVLAHKTPTVVTSIHRTQYKSYTSTVSYAHAVANWPLGSTDDSTRRSDDRVRSRRTTSPNKIILDKARCRWTWECPSNMLANVRIYLNATSAGDAGFDIQGREITVLEDLFGLVRSEDDVAGSSKALWTQTDTYFDLAPTLDPSSFTPNDYGGHQTINNTSKMVQFYDFGIVDGFRFQ